MVQLIDQHIDPITAVHQDERATKFLMQTHDGHTIESVIMTMHGRKSLCLSSQIGCRMGCAFCQTGQMGFTRNLSCEEMVQQIFASTHLLKASVKNVVFMGMGEPFDNFDAVMQAVKVLTDPLGFGIGMRRITISTSGHIEGILRVAAEKRPTPNLAVSLGAPTEAIRWALMPHYRKQSLAELYDAMYRYCQQRQRHVLLSYVLIQTVNDSLSAADLLAAYVEGLNVRINVIPYNSFPSSRFVAPSPQATDAFVARLRSHNLPVFLRQERGASINAACGQLGASR
jgi:23S rRNA (adenine2503-C2)-methyltransferase